MASVFRLTVWLHKGQSIFNLGLLIFSTETHWFRTGTRDFSQDDEVTITSNKITESFNVFNLTSFYFLASVWKFGSDKTKEKEEDKTQKTTKMRRGTIEGSLSLKKSTMKFV